MRTPARSNEVRLPISGWNGREMEWKSLLTASCSTDLCIRYMRNMAYTKMQDGFQTAQVHKHRDHKCIIANMICSSYARARPIFRNQSLTINYPTRESADSDSAVELIPPSQARRPSEKHSDSPHQTHAATSLLPFLLQLLNLLLDNRRRKLPRPHRLHPLCDLRPLLRIELRLHVDLRRLQTFALSSQVFQSWFPSPTTGDTPVLYSHLLR